MKQPKYIGGTVYDFVWGYGRVVQERGDRIRVCYSSGVKKGKLSGWHDVDKETWGVLNSRLEAISSGVCDGRRLC